MADSPSPLCHLADHKFLVNVHHSRTFPYVHLAHDGVGNHGDTLHDVGYERGALQRIVAAIGEQEVGLKTDEIHLMAIDVFLKLLSGMLAGEAVGVVAVWQEEHLDFHSFAKKHVDAAQAGLYAGHVAIIEDGDIVGEAVNQPDLSFCQRCARRGHDVFNTALVHRNDVRISLHQETAALLDNSVLRQIETVEFVALMINLRFRRIYILGHFAVRRHHASAECHDLARHGMHREYDPAVIAIH